MPGQVQIEAIESQPFAENTYLLWRSGQEQAVVIDPGLEPELILAAIAEHSLRVVAILNTHGHADHIAGNAAMKQAFPEATLLIGAGDAKMLSDPWANMSAYFGYSITSPPADQLVQAGDVVEAADLRFEVLEVPGHSPGHVAFVLREAPILVYGGDVLMRDSIGRTDIPGGSTPQLLASIRGQLFALPDDTVVYPGHGPTTTIGHEKQGNPFVGARAQFAL